MQNSRLGHFFLAISYFLNIGVWTHHFHFALKIAYAIVAGIITLLTLINQWNVFYKNYRTVWIVIKIEHVVSWFIPKKLRHRSKNILFKKNQGNNPKT